MLKKGGGTKRSEPEGLSLKNFFYNTPLASKLGLGPLNRGRKALKIFSSLFIINTS